MLRKFGQAVVIAALITAVGGHWAVLQTVAWTSMLAQNLRSGSLEAAITKTFDGEHPCQLCKVISAGKKAEKKTDFPSSSAKKLEFVSERLTFIFSPPQAFRLLPEVEVTPHACHNRPPVPPPRFASV